MKRITYLKYLMLIVFSISSFPINTANLNNNLISGGSITIGSLISLITVFNAFRPNDMIDWSNPQAAKIAKNKAIKELICGCTIGLAFISAGLYLYKK